MKTKKIAEVVSLVFGPLLFWPLMLVVIANRTRLSYEQYQIMFPAVLFFQIAVPLLLFFAALKKKKFSDFDITERKQRIIPLLTLTGLMIPTMILAKIAGNKFFFDMYLMLFSVVVVNAIITFRWKISLHMAVATLGILIINYLYYWQFSLMIFIVPLLFWSRFYLRRHTFYQLLFGCLFSAAVFFVFLYQGNYLTIR
ncbi:hypothetical protein GYA28_00880 [Candidatus Roizmanbacteria bacterium]|jgi:hypothetical protein|nr:hypothetical protein [Candidatus Roizmanbacteria bacterium]